jgi:hypothetical protein
MSYSTNLRIEKQDTGSNTNTWGDHLNSAIDRFDDAIAGYVALTIAATGAYALQSANSNTTADEARRAHLKLTGSPSANFNVIIPSVSKNYWIWNATSKVATITTGSGGTATVEAGDKVPVWCDGTNVNDGIYFGSLNLKNYIASITATAGAVPGVTGNAGKYLYNDGISAFWRQPSTADLSDYQTLVLGVQVALAVAL